MKPSNIKEKELRKKNARKGAIRKSIKEERDYLKSSFLSAVKIDFSEEKPKIDLTYLILSLISFGMFIFFYFIRPDLLPYSFFLYMLLYFSILLIPTAMYSTTHMLFFKYIRNLCALPLFFALAILRFLGLNEVLNHLISLIIDMLVILFTAITFFMHSENMVSALSNYLQAQDSAQDAQRLFWVLFFLLMISVILFLLYVVLRLIYVTLRAGDRSCKINIFNEIWSANKLLIYLASTIINISNYFTKRSETDISSYFFISFTIIILADAYLKKTKKK